MKISFEVSAKAARLIGRENIADVDGALSELIKNAYDADASCVYVDFYVPFAEIPSQVAPERFSSVLSSEDQNRIANFYHLEDGKLKRRDNLSEKEKLELQNILFSYDRIIIADNGEGMSMDTVRSSWMQIATSTKETRIESPKGRIKTGAKGIGRFALDKLSQRSTMYTKSAGGKMIRWTVDWDQFTNVHLLRDVYADIEESDLPFQSILQWMLEAEALCQIANFSWDTGTIFILSPIREPWTPRLFGKVNTNLGSINPLGSADEFTVIVNNQTMPKYSYRTQSVAIAQNDYDYRLNVDYNGADTLTVKILRNEFDICKQYATFTAGGHTKRFPLQQFWARPAFSKKPFRKEDMDGKTHTYHIQVDNIIEAEDKDIIRTVGPFSAELFFVKNGKSNFAFIKEVPTLRRKDLLKRFSGIKLYRDNFKVRPYGDESGGMFDWLELDERANKSPASVANLNGQWRVRSYQMIGVVKIGRTENAALYDMANREGLTPNESYYCFVSILQEAISRFESDRQYIYREYARWKKACEDSLSTIADRVMEDVQTHGVAGREKVSDASDSAQNGKQKEESDAQFTERDYREAVDQLIQMRERDLQAKQTLEALSSAGVILNTFFHELRGVRTQMVTRGTQMRARLDNLLNNQPYCGEAYMDPYRKLEDYDRIDKILGAWLNVVMQAIEKENLVTEEISLAAEVNKITEIWKQLLEEKRIYLRLLPENESDQSCMLRLAVVDLYVIINNFVLNAVWFLEQRFQETRIIQISLDEDGQSIFMRMENNGPPLSDQYRDQPMRIFDIGETNKPGGTGLGLFLMREVVERTDGEIRPMEMTDGFGIEIQWRK